MITDKDRTMLPMTQVVGSCQRQNDWLTSAAVIYGRVHWTYGLLGHVGRARFRMVAHRAQRTIARTGVIELSLPLNSPYMTLQPCPLFPCPSIAITQCFTELPCASYHIVSLVLFFFFFCILFIGRSCVRIDTLDFLVIYIYY